MFKEASDKLIGVGRRQVMNALTRSDEAHRQAEFTIDGEYHAAFCRAIELGQDDATRVDRLLELGRLNECILAGGRIEDKEHLMRRRVNTLPTDPINLLQFFH